MRRTVCKRGHPLTPENISGKQCRICKRQCTRDWKRRRRAANRNPPRTACRKGHPFPESRRPGRSDCAVCHRERSVARARERGVPARQPRARVCTHGHVLTPATRRPGRGDCAICHRESQRARYRSNPVRYAQEASDYQRRNRAARTAAQKDWRHRNKARYNEMTVAGHRRRTFGVDAESYEYSALIRRDPCCYCGRRGGSIDHIEPSVKGGTNEWANLTGACRRCNSWKRDRPLLLFLARRIQHIRRQSA